MKNEIICSILYGTVYRELGDEFLTSVTAEGKRTVCLPQSDQNCIRVGPQKRDCEVRISVLNNFKPVIQQLPGRAAGKPDPHPCEQFVMKCY